MDHEAGPWDVIVVGAGIYGIQFARTYLELHPQGRIVILEASSSIGGVWSKDRVYREFITQTPLGLLEFSDRRLDVQDHYHGFFKAHNVATYLEEYCGNHCYGGTSLRSRIHTNEPVLKLERDDDLWHAFTTSSNMYRSRKVVDASGLTSIPRWPTLPNHRDFEGTLIHHKDFAKWEHRLKDGNGQKIVVIGGAKSAADVAYQCAKDGCQVTWVIRRSGSGPAAFVSAKGRIGYANSNESFYTRATSLFLTSLFSLTSGYTGLLRLINNTRTGRRLLRWIWTGINDKAWKEADYDRTDGQANGFFNLKPDTELFWQNDSTGINQRDDFFDVVAREVRVIREDISDLCRQGVALMNGEVLEADVIICATGWKTKHPYINDRLAIALGLPVAEHVVSPEQRERYGRLDSAADEAVVTRFPILDSGWARSARERSARETHAGTPFRLWKSIVPVTDPSILFLGKLMLGNHFRAAEVQALFACGVLDGLVALPSKEQMEQDTSMTVAWCRRRYLSKGSLGDWFYWDMVPYTDMLLRELGLHSHRHTSWLEDLLGPCYARDLAGLLDEYREKLTKTRKAV